MMMMCVLQSSVCVRVFEMAEAVEILVAKRAERGSASLSQETVPFIPAVAAIPTTDGLGELVATGGSGSGSGGGGGGHSDDSDGLDMNDDDDDFDLDDHEMTDIIRSVSSIIPLSPPPPPRRVPSALTTRISEAEEAEVRRIYALPRAPAPGWDHTCRQACGRACDSVCKHVCLPCAVLFSCGEEGYGLLWFLYISSPSRRFMTVVLLALLGFTGFLAAAVMNPVTLLHTLVYIPVAVSCVAYRTPVPWHAFIRPEEGTCLKTAYWDASVGFVTGMLMSGAIGGIIVPVFRLGVSPGSMYFVVVSHFAMILAISVTIAPRLYDEDGPIDTS